MNDRDYAYYISLAVGGILAASLIFYFIIGKNVIQILPCAIYQATGIYCPACGGTRAFLALCRGDFLASVYYHPIVLYTLFLYGAFILEETRERLFRCRRKVPLGFWRGCVRLGLVILLGNMAVRNILKFCFQLPL